MRQFKNRIFFAATLAITIIAGANARTYTVAPGDSLSSIARKELGSQAKWKEIADLNNLAAPYRLRLGMELRIPEASQATDTQIPPSTPDSDSPTLPTIPAADTVLILPPRDTIVFDTAPFEHLIHPPGALVLHNVEEAVALARSVNPEYRALRADAEAARTALLSARLAGRFNPEIEGEVGRRNEEATNVDPARSHTDFEVGVSQEVEIAGQTAARRAVAELEITRQMLNAAWQERQIAAEIKGAFVRALAARDRLSLLREAERIRRHLESVTRERLEAGDVAGLELSLAEVELARSTSARTRGEEQYQASISELAKAIGISTDSPLVVDGYLITPAPVSQNLVVNALARPDLKEAQLEEKIFLGQAQRALAEGRPNITVGGGYRREETTTDIYFARIGIPLPFWNKNKGEAARLTHEADAVAARAESLRRSILLEVERDSVGLTLARRRLAQLEPALQKANENLSLLEDARQEGLVSMAEYFFMQSASLEAREEFLEALEEANLAVIELERSSGTELYFSTGRK
jgi:outer membrane protein, heavy metal efflux system